MKESSRDCYVGYARFIMGEREWKGDALSIIMIVACLFRQLLNEDVLDYIEVIIESEIDVVTLLDGIKEKVQHKFNINLKNKIDEVTLPPSLVSLNSSCSKKTMKYLFKKMQLHFFVNPEENHRIDFLKKINKVLNWTKNYLPSYHIMTKINPSWFLLKYQ